MRPDTGENSAACRIWEAHGADTLVLPLPVGRIFDKDEPTTAGGLERRLALRSGAVGQRSDI